MQVLLLYWLGLFRLIASHLYNTYNQRRFVQEEVCNIYKTTFITYFLHGTIVYIIHTYTIRTQNTLVINLIIPYYLFH